MIEYLCHRCGYNTHKKSNLIQHLNRKKICKPILGDISIEEIKKHYNFEINEIPQNKYHKIFCHKIPTFATKYHTFTTK